MDVNLPEGHAIVLFLSPTTGCFERGILLMPFHEVAAEHNHARHPEEKNLVRRDEQRGRIENRLIARLLRPAQRCERQQPRRKPGVEHVRNLFQLRAPTLRTTHRRFPRDDNFLTTIARPRRDAMSPPQLARDAPVINIIHPVQINLPVVVRDDGDFAALHRLYCAVSEWLDFDEPLLGEPRLNHGPAAVALAQGERVIFFADQKSLLLQIRKHTFAGFIAIESRVRARVLVHVRVLVHHVNLGQFVTLARLKIVGIVRRGHLHRSGAELRLRQFVDNDRNLAIH